MASITKTALKAVKFYKHVVQSVEKFILKVCIILCMFQFCRMLFLDHFRHVIVNLLLLVSQVVMMHAVNIGAPYKSS